MIRSVISISFLLQIGRLFGFFVDYLIHILWSADFLQLLLFGDLTAIVAFGGSSIRQIS